MFLPVPQIRNGKELDLPKLWVLSNHKSQIQLKMDINQMEVSTETSTNVSAETSRGIEVIPVTPMGSPATSPRPTSTATPAALKRAVEEDGAAPKRKKYAPCAIPEPEGLDARIDRKVTHPKDVKDVYTWMHLESKRQVTDNHKHLYGKQLLDAFYETQALELMKTPAGLLELIFVLDQASRCSFNAPRTLREDTGVKFYKTCWQHSTDKTTYAPIYKLFRKFENYRAVEWMYNLDKFTTVKQVVATWKREWQEHWARLPSQVF
jgi:hypothetical protein